MVTSRRRTVCALSVLALTATGLVLSGPPAATGAACTLAGTSARDVLTGTPGRDVICGRGGNDVLRGLGGNDVLRGGAGNDALLPGPGRNIVRGGRGADTVRYDRLSRGKVIVDLASGTVTGAVTDTVTRVENAVGTDRDDHLSGTSDRNVLDGGAGNDVIVGRGAADRLFGARGADSIAPGHGTDLAVGGRGLDEVDYSDVSGWVDVDLAQGWTQAPTGDDTVSEFENLVGSRGADTLRGTDGPNVIDAGSGIDHVHPGLGDDHVDGGGDHTETPLGDNDADTIDFSDVATTGVDVDLSLGTLGGTGAGSVEGFDFVVGTPQDDTLIGNGSYNDLWGGAGDDTIDARGSDDFLGGGPGSDFLVPGPDSASEAGQGVSGGEGLDSVSFADAQSALWVEDQFGRWHVSTVDLDIADTDVDGVEVLHGTAWADHLYGGLGAAEVTFHGMGGADDMNTEDGYGGDAMVQESPGTGSTCVGDPADTASC